MNPLSPAPFLRSGLAAAPERPQQDLIMSDAFDYAIPARWNRRPSEDGGVVLAAPADAHDVSALITIRHCPPGDPDFADFDAFVARQTGPPMFASSPPTEILPGRTVVGRKARAFARNSSLFVPPNRCTRSTGARSNRSSSRSSPSYNDPMTTRLAASLTVLACLLASPAAAEWRAIPSTDFAMKPSPAPGTPDSDKDFAALP